MGGEGRELTLSTRADRETKGDESVDQGSFTPSRYASSRGTSQVNGYSCCHYKRVTPYQKETPHTSFRESGGAGSQYGYARIGTQVELSSDTPLGISPVLNIPTFPPTCIESLCSVKVYIGKVRERDQGSTVQGSAVTLKGNVTHYKNKQLFVRFGFQSHMQSTVPLDKIQETLYLSSS